LNEDNIIHYNDRIVAVTHHVTIADSGQDSVYVFAKLENGKAFKWHALGVPELA
jgi:hypothetical protein